MRVWLCSVRGFVVLSQLQAPATDSYYTEDPELRNYILPSTILHESLHNLLHLNDNDLRKFLGLLPIAALGTSTVDINWALELNGCAHGMLFPHF